MPEVINDGHTGFLVADADEMAQVLPRVKEIKRRECRRWVEKRFTVERMVDDYIRVYEKILAQQNANKRTACQKV